MIIKLIIFLFFSAGLVIWSIKSSFNRRVHGFYRLFSFKLFLALIIINADKWFHNPLSINQIISWILLLSSITLAIHGFYLLHKIGMPAQGIEATTKVVRIGIYQYIRHPLYSSLILLTWGVFLKEISFLSLILSILASIFLIVTALVEEQENLRKFGEEYRSYMKSTRRFLPFIV
jgi:protein-S-isoprenylcysteine O-methyltransferase Ste14